MKKIRIALSIAALLGTMAVVGVSSPQSTGAGNLVLSAPACDCVLHNPEGLGVLKDGSCDEIRCYTVLD